MDSYALTPCPAGVGVLEEEDVGMMHPVVSGTDTFCSMVDLDSACGADHKDNPFVDNYRVIIFLYGMHGW